MKHSNEPSKVRVIDRSAFISRLLVPAGICAGAALSGLAILILYSQNA